MNTTRRQTLLACLACLPAGVLAQALPPQPLPFTAVVSDALSPATRSEAQQWLARSAQAVSAYLGSFPAPQAVITLVAGEGSGIGSGRTFDAPPVSIRVVVGVNTTRERFLADWVMVHEMVHLAIPQLPRRHNWFHEGVATYAEIIARARAGLTSHASAWEQLMRNLHQGLPLAGEGGMDGTQRWGRLYWGGALFCLLADIDIRQRTDSRLGLQDALAGAVRAGSHYGQRWSMARTLEMADTAVGSPALSELYAQFRDVAVATDLPRLFRDLGVLRSDDGVRLLAEAPLASARRAILPD